MFRKKHLTHKVYGICSVCGVELCKSTGLGAKADKPTCALHNYWSKENSDE